MLALQHPRQQHPFAFSDGMDPSPQDSYLARGMNPYLHLDQGAAFASLPFSWYEGASFCSETPAQTADLAIFPSRPNIPFIPSPPRPQLRSELSIASESSISSKNSSMIGSPHQSHAQLGAGQQCWNLGDSGFGPEPTIVSNDTYDQGFGPSDFGADVPFHVPAKKAEDFVDPSLIHPSSNAYPDTALAFSNATTYQHSLFDAASAAVSPDPSHTEQMPQDSATHLHPDMSTHIFHNSYQHSPYLRRRTSVTSINSGPSRQSPACGSADLEVESQDKGRCPHPDCGRVFKDLKAHMLTHQSERPEKCPILNCEYNQKGFARKYDKNRHTLTHYKGNMVCGFCPGSGSSIEKSFNRADVFKRHLTSVHAVEQSPPNSRKRCHAGTIKKPTSYCQDATGKCSTCSATFSNAQDFYEHLDDCVLRVVQQEEPSEAINHHHLAEIAADEAVKATMERNLPHDAEEATKSTPDYEHDAKDDDGANEDVGEERGDDREDGRRDGRCGKGTIRSSKHAPLSQTAMRGGIRKSSQTASKAFPLSRGEAGPLATTRRKRRKEYPASWGRSLDQMKMKKRAVYVYDGERRLWKDDMMLNEDLEVRVNLADGKSYVTDLDVMTLKGMSALGGAAAEAQGPWIQEGGGGIVDLDALMA